MLSYNPSARWYERYAWILLFASGLLLLLSASFRLFVLRGAPEAMITEAVAGMNWEQIKAASPPGTATVYQLASRAWAVVEVGFAILVMVLTWIPYRRGERWAWYVLWVVPAVFIGGIGNTILASVSPAVFIPLTLAAVLALLLPLRIYFPRS